jgi:hypothetical protein
VRIFWLFASLVALLAGGVLHAQSVSTGAIRGRVIDRQQAPVPFATVTAKSPAMQGQRTTTTATDGTYVLPQLPAGEYILAFEATRLAATGRTTIVPLGASVELNVVLQDAGSPDRASQAGERAGLVASPTVAAHFRHDEIDALASARTLSAIAALAPGVTTNAPDLNQVTIHGAFGYDNRFLLNGADIADNLLGTPQDLYVEDAIAETAVLTSGLPAEYGRLTGGVVNAITRSGGNRFSGSYRANLSNPSWTTATPFERCDPAVTVATCRPAAARPDELLASHEGTVGGFVVKDRLWFFGAGRLVDDDNAAPLPLSGVLNTEAVSNQRGEIKLTANLGGSHTLTFDTGTNKTTIDGQPPFASTVDRFAVGARRIPNYYDVASYRAALGKRTFVEGQFSLRRWERHDTASASAAIVDSPMFARTILSGGAPAQYNTPYFDAGDPEKRNSVQGGGSVTQIVDGGAGHHEVKGGFEIFRSQRIGGGSQTPTGYVFDTDYLAQPGGTTPALDANGRVIPLWIPGETLIENWMPKRGATLNVDTQSIYIQDRWTIGSRLSADLGVRHDRTRTKATDTFNGIDTRTLQPRLGVGYRVDERYHQTIHATYGHYAGRYDEAQVARNTSIANPDLWVGVYFGAVGQGRSFAAGLDPANYLTLAGRFPTSNVSVDSALQSPLVRELTASYAVEPGGGRGFVQAAYVWRDWRRFVDDFVSIANGTTHVIKSGFDVGTFTNVAYRNADEATHTYSAIELFGRYEIRRNWTMNGSYTLQLENDGNDPGEAAGMPGATSALGNYPEIFTAARHYPDGRLPAFERSTLRLWSTGRTDLGRAGALTISALVRANSGRVYSLAAVNQPLTAIQIARLQAAGYPDRPAGQTVFFGDRGSETFGGCGVVDLAVAYDIPVLKTLRPWAKLEIYNALDNQTPIAFDTTVVPDAATPTDALGLNTGYRPAATFGKTTSADQFPAPFPGATGGRTFRVAIGMRF